MTRKKIVSREPCRTCSGTGKSRNRRDEIVRCPNCNGSGKIKREL